MDHGDSRRGGGEVSLLLAAALTLSLQDRAPVLKRSPKEWPRAEQDAWLSWDPTRSDPPREAARGPLRRALEATERRDFVAALGAWFALLEAEPGYPPALYQAGVVYFRLRRYSDAALAFERYLAAAPHRVVDTRALGHCHYSLGRYAEAALHYERVLAAGETPGVLFGLGLARLRLGEEALALERLERVVELDPAHAEAHTWLGQLHFDVGRTEEARAALERAQALDPFAARPWFVLARVLVELGEEGAGERAHERFMSLERVAQEARTLEGRLLYDAHQPMIYERLVQLHVEIGDIVGVRGALERWTALEPEGVRPRAVALTAWGTLGRPEDARSAAAGLALVAGDSAEAWAVLARHYREPRERVLQVQAEERWRQAVRAADSPDPVD